MRKILYIILISTLCPMFPLSKSYAQQGWYNQPSSTNAQLFSVYFINANTGCIAGGSSSFDGIIMRTTNSGIGWNSQLIVTNNYFHSIYFPDTNTGYAVGGLYSGYDTVTTILKTMNGGLSWGSQVPPKKSYLTSVHFINNTTGYISGQSGTILKTTNGGINWIILPPASSNSYNSIFFINSYTGFVVGGSNNTGIIQKTANGGSSWTQQSPLGYNSYLRTIFFADVSTGYFIGGYINPFTSVIFKTTNTGANWFALTSNTNSTLKSIYFTDENTGYVVGNNGTIRKTTNGGNNWFSQSSGTNNVLHSVFFVNNLTGWAVGDNGTILKTTTGGVLLPSAPVLYSPPNGSVGISLTPFLDWTNVYTATTYGVQVSTEPSFAAPLIDVSNLSASQYIVPNELLTNNIIYYWRANASNEGGIGPWSNIWNFTTLITGVQKYSVKIPGEFDLYQNYPNPFNPATSIKFDISKSSFVNIKIYDMLGRQVTELVNQKLEPGSYQVEWNASNYTSGMYLYNIVAEANNERFERNMKMVLLK